MNDKGDTLMCFNTKELSILQKKLIERHEFSETINDLHIRLFNYEEAIKKALRAESEHKDQKRLWEKEMKESIIREQEYNNIISNQEQIIKKTQKKIIKYSIVAAILGYGAGKALK